jgi:glycogen operon protein
MLLHGDEMGRTQYGNNNGYCQDSEISWMEWAPEKADIELMTYTGEVSALRAAHPVFRRRRFFNGREIRPVAPTRAEDDYQRDIAWFTASGEEMTDEDWEAGSAAVLTVFLNGEGILESDQRGERVVDDSFLLIFNAHHEDAEVTLPGAGLPDRWGTVLDTVTGTVVVGTTRTSATTTVHELPDDLATLGGGDTLPVVARSMVLLQRTDAGA